MAARDFRMGIVGCGRISQFHIDAIEKVDGLTLAAVCDVDEGRARAAGETAGVSSFASLDAMLKGTDLDIVAVCTPSGLHPEHGIAAARAGKHVVSEKPMALSLDGADALIAACGERDRRWQRPQEYYEGERWRRTWKPDGGAIMNQASHYVDLLQWLVGPVESVMAKTATQARPVEAEDSGAAELAFASGAIGRSKSTSRRGRCNQHEPSHGTASATKAIIGTWSRFSAARPLPTPMVTKGRSPWR